MENFSIYKFTFSDGKVYIGQTGASVEDRWKNGEGYKNQPVYIPITIEGWDNIKKEILHTNLTKSQADKLESYYIKKFNAIENGYNKVMPRPSNEKSNQKIVTIDRTTPLDTNYFNFEHELYWAANRRLHQSGLTVYMYFMSIVPDTWDMMPNKDNKRTMPFEVSPKNISNVTGKDTKSTQRGINELIEVGYLIFINGNKYQFIDILPKDRAQTLKEHTKLLEYEAAIRAGIEVINKENDKHLKILAQEHVAKEHSNEENKILTQYSWEPDEDYKERISKITKKTSIQELD